MAIRSTTMLLCLTFSIMCANNALAKVQRMPLSDYVEDSNLIVTGRVALLSQETVEIRTDWGQTSTYRTAVFAVEEVIAGHLEDDHVAILFGANSSVEPNYRVGERYLLFVKEIEGRRYSTNWYGGSLLIRNDIIDYIYMDKEERTQSLHQFIEKIRGILKRMDDGAE